MDPSQAALASKIKAYWMLWPRLLLAPPVEKEYDVPVLPLLLPLGVLGVLIVSVGALMVTVFTCDMLDVTLV